MGYHAHRGVSFCDIIKILDHDLGFEIDLVIIFRAAAILFLLPVLAHHDERRLDRRDAGQNQIQQDKWERIERICRQNRIDAPSFV